MDNFKGNFLNISILFLHPQIADFQIIVSQPNIVLTNHTSMESLCIQLLDDINLNLEKWPLLTGLVVHGHISSGSFMQLSNVSCDLLIYYGKIN